MTLKEHLSAENNDQHNAQAHRDRLLESYDEEL